MTGIIEGKGPQKHHEMSVERPETYSLARKG